MAQDKLRDCGLVGSLRVGSFNKALLRAAQELAPEPVDITSFEGLRDVPLYDADLEAQGDPPAVVALKEAIRNAHALLIVTPEYNYSVPGVLKNALDWASRPPGKSVLGGKPVAIMGATPGTGGTARAQLALRQCLHGTDCMVMPRPEVLVARATEKFDAQGKLVDEATRKAVKQLVEALPGWTGRFTAP